MVIQTHRRIYTHNIHIYVYNIYRGDTQQQIIAAANQMSRVRYQRAGIRTLTRAILLSQRQCIVLMNDYFFLCYDIR